MRVSSLQSRPGRRVMALGHRSAAALVCLAALSVAAPAWSATVSELRVGQHPGFTRVVFELDSAAGYRLERSTSADGTPVVIVTISAGVAPSAPRNVRSASSLLESVSLAQPQDRAVATVRLRRAGLPIKEMILRGPPRIVLDVVGEDTALAARARPPKRRAEPPGPSPEEPVARAEPPEASPEKPVAPAKPPQPSPEEPVARAEPPPGPAPETPETKPRAQPPQAAPAPQPPAPKPQTAAERAAQEAMDRRLAAVREAAEQRKRQLEEERRSREAAEQQRREAEAERKRREEAEAATPAADGPDGPGALLIGGLVGVLLVGVIVAVVLARRRSLPRDLDVTAFGPGDEPGSTGEEEDSREAEASAEKGRETRVGAGASSAPLSAPGLFDDSEKGESAMETHAQDLSIGRDEPVAAPAGGPDLKNAVADLERRLSALESQLQESNAARERLERQVAAQSEELRVQRAAIARTQRALRGLSRSEEEQATEPALRD